MATTGETSARCTGTMAEVFETRLLRRGWEAPQDYGIAVYRYPSVTAEKRQIKSAYYGDVRVLELWKHASAYSLCGLDSAASAVGGRPLVNSAPSQLREAEVGSIGGDVVLQMLQDHARQYARSRNTTQKTVCRRMANANRAQVEFDEIDAAYKPCISYILVLHGDAPTD